MAFEQYYYAEMTLPSVIIDMPELRRMAARRRALRVFWYSAAAITFAALAGLIYLELNNRPIEMVQAEALEVKDTAAGSLKLTIKTAPEGISGAVVEVDGEVISGNPPYVYLSPSDEYHSIKISAPGYDVTSKDVQVAASEVMTFSLTAKNAPVVADAEDMIGEYDHENIDDSEFAENSDDLIEEIFDDAPAGSGERRRGGKGVGRKGNERERERERGKGGNGRRGRAGRNGGVAIQSVSLGFGQSATSQANGAEAGAPVVTAPSATTAESPASPQPVASGSAGAATDTPPGRITTVPAQPLAGGGAASSGAGVGAAVARQHALPAKASLIINAPLGISSRVRVSVDGQMRGYLPVLLKVDPGLHELTFMTDGRRTFQMVKLNSGQIVRIIPNL